MSIIKVVCKSEGKVDCFLGNFGDTVCDVKGRPFGVITKIAKNGIVTVDCKNEWLKKIQEEDIHANL